MKTLIPRRRAQGFTLIELMISVVIGLLAILFATRMMTDTERNKDGALGGSQSMQNGMMAMFTISGDAEQAGFGLNDPLLVGCNTIFYDRFGYELAEAKRGEAGVMVRPLAAAVIEHGEAGPDKLSLYSGSAMSGTPTMRLIENYLGSSELSIDREPYGFNVGDVIVVAPEDGVDECALAQISTLSGSGTPKLGIANTNTRFNKGELGRNFAGSTSRVFNLGRASGLAFHTWQVEDNVLRLSAANLGNSGNSQAVADNIVSLKAQYGFDKRAAADFDPEQGMQVGEWSNTMIDADGDGEAGGPGDYQRISALRIAVVARNKAPERPADGGECSTTTAVVKVFGSEQPNGVDPVEVTLDLDDEAATIDWKCYRYRVFETIVPLRNAGWRPTA